MRISSFFAALACVSSFVHAQVIHPPKPGELRRLSEWQAHPLARVEKTREWLVYIRFRLTSREPGFEVPKPGTYCCPETTNIPNLLPYNDPFPNKRLRESNRVHVRSQIITLPFVERSALQDVDLVSLKSDLQIDNSLLTIPARPLAYLPSMQREIGWVLDAGPDDSFGWGYCELDVQFAATLRSLVYKREDLAHLPAPKKWPEEVMGTFEPQAYIDFAPQPNGFVQPIDEKRITTLVQQVANKAGVNPRQTPVPSELAYRFAHAVFGGIRNRDDTLTPWSRDKGRARAYSQKYKTSEPRPTVTVEMPRLDPDTFNGIPVRDILNIWAEGIGTEPERCAVLVAALRKFNVPARLMIGVELDESNLDEAFTPRSGITRTESTTITPATGPDDPNPNQPETAHVTGVIATRPATVVAWVEFATFDPELNELIWVPIDPGSGGNSWKFGKLDNAEHIVALATNFWPKDIQFIGRSNESVLRFGDDIDYWRANVADWQLPAALFGMQSSAPVYSTCNVEWRVTGRKASQREIDEFRSVERIPVTKESMDDSTTNAPAHSAPTKSPQTSTPNQSGKPATPTGTKQTPAPTKKPK